MAELRIGEVAARTGVSLDTLRYYERRKLQPRAHRTRGGFRLFEPEVIEQVLFIKHAQEIGLSLNEIKELLTVGEGASECRRVGELLRSKLAEPDERMKAINSFRNTLARHLDTCEHELAEQGRSARCPVVSITRP